ncbi:MAG: extracellular solute-binding protein [Paenibacillaceae bacterium]|uniref:Extracellular solute-binding protein n=1 Tax=Paenibacillus mellifer TaxID=2937794 RepID=A0A9X1XYH6_9BACL|nr:extracellular solute-binding protein [Paenibacillus mellifer]MBW4838712.1 extracellular solute-binding protein [Paenibacillaceae bacterium]MCK8487213.1 extracellular solute-binding protein [Paenibacillus mellifer]
MKRNVKRLTSLLLACAILVGLAGCGGGDRKDGSGANAQGDRITLKFIWWGGPVRKDMTLKVIDLYEQKHPNVTIETEDYPDNPTLARYLAMETADQAEPDLIQMDYSFVFNYINRDLVEPLTPYVESGLLNLSDIPPAYLPPGQSEGQQYAIPLGINALSMAYDPAMFEDYGITPLPEEYTVDEFYNVLKQFKEKVNKEGFYPLDNMFDFSYWLRSKGESLYNSEGTALGFTDANMVEYLRLIQTWIEEGLLNPKVDIAQATIGDTNRLASGDTAFFPMPSNQIVNLGKLAGRTIKMINLPSVPGGQEGNFIKPSQFLTVSSYSKHREEAVKFLDYFLNSTEANDILLGERGVPLPASISARLQDKADAQAKEQYTYMDYVSEHSTPIDPPAPSKSGVVNNMLQLTINNLIAGSLTPEQAASKFRQDADNTLGQGGTGK